jgi:hypothetical protein
MKRKLLAALEVPVLAVGLLIVGSAPAMAARPLPTYSTIVTSAGANGSTWCYIVTQTSWSHMSASVTKVEHHYQLGALSWNSVTLDGGKEGYFKSGRTGSFVYSSASVAKNSTSGFYDVFYGSNRNGDYELGTSETVSLTFDGTNGCTVVS